MKNSPKSPFCLGNLPVKKNPSPWKISLFPYPSSRMSLKTPNVWQISVNLLTYSLFLDALHIFFYTKNLRISSLFKKSPYFFPSLLLKSPNFPPLKTVHVSFTFQYNLLSFSLCLESLPISAYFQENCLFPPPIILDSNLALITSFGVLFSLLFVLFFFPCLL